MKLLITAEFDESYLAELRRYYDVEYVSWRATGKIYLDSVEFAQKLKESGAEAVVVEPDVVDEYVIDQCNLKVICSCRSNPNNVSIDYATKKGIPVIHSPARNADSVADLTLGLIVTLLRKVAFADRDLHAGKVRVEDDRSMVETYNRYTGREVAPLTYGIIGFGAVGYRVAIRLSKGFGAKKILYYDPYVSESDPRIKETGALRADLDYLVARSDVVTLHAKASDENFRMITREKFALMKPTSVFVNTARSSLIDEDALFDLLKERRIAGAALDVSETEPIDSSNRFLELDNVIVTPHIGGSTRDVVTRQSALATEELVRFAKGERLVNLANPEVYGGG
jgi:phosphoglycerate dehydrogenase-like enzyme